MKFKHVVIIFAIVEFATIVAVVVFGLNKYLEVV